MEIEKEKSIEMNDKESSEEQAIFQMLRHNDGPFNCLHCLIGNTKSEYWDAYVHKHLHKCIPRVIILPDIIHISFNGEILYQNDKRMDVYKHEIQRAIKLVKDYQLRNKKRKSKGKQIWK